MVTKLPSDGTERVTNISCLPPLKFGDSFGEVYEVILILDDREQFATKGYIEHLIFFSSHFIGFEISYDFIMKV